MNPIFILGLTQRTGTNWLSECFKLHPDITGTAVPEAYLIYYSDNLKIYTDHVAGRWRPWFPKEKISKILTQTIGSALFNLILEQSPNLDKRCEHIFLRTPSVRCIRLLHHFFPESKVIVLTRDGRSVAESHSKGFGSSFRTFTKQYKQAVRELTHFLKTTSNRHLVKVVSYEQLVLNFRPEMESIFNFLEIGAELYDWEAAEQIPVYGSSFFGLKDGALHWAPVEKTADFNPLARYQNWSWIKKLIYFLTVGKEHETFKYDKNCGESAATRCDYQKSLQI